MILRLANYSMLVLSLFLIIVFCHLKSSEGNCAWVSLFLSSFGAYQVLLQRRAQQYGHSSTLFRDRKTEPRHSPALLHEARVSPRDGNSRAARRSHSQTLGSRVALFESLLVPRHFGYLETFPFWPDYDALSLVI